MRFKKTLLIGVGSILMFTMGGVGPAQADNGKHISTAQGAGVAGGLVNNAGGRCAGCHRAHTAKAEYLLKVSQPQLCYSCHSAGVGANTDVTIGSEFGTGLALRGGGFSKALIKSDSGTKDTGALDANGRMTTTNQTVPALAVGVTTTSKHLIDGVTAGTAWGNGTDASGAGKSLTLECGSCHDPQRRRRCGNVSPIPVDSGYAVHEIKAAIPAVVDNPATPLVDETAAAVPAVMSPAAGINIPDAVGKVYTTANYWLSGDSNVPVDATATLTGTKKTTDLAADGYINNIANWCTTCHTRYLAVSGSYGKARVGTGTLTQGNGTVLAGVDTNFTYQHRTDANYKGNAANCITCHVSHGSNATMNGAALTVANPGATLTEFGDASASSADSKLLRVDNRGTCAMCHNV